MGFQNLFNRFRSSCESGAQQSEHDRGLKLATAGLLLDIAHADDQFSPVERDQLLAYFQTSFDLSPEEAHELIEAANELRSKTIDHFDFANLLRKNTSLEERIEIVKTMWRLVYSDGRLGDYEEYLVRKLAQLLGLEHHVMIQAKLEAKE